MATAELTPKPAGSAPRDSRAVAQLLIAHLGEMAPCHATHQALKARQRGDLRSMESWLWIAGAAREILRTEPEAPPSIAE